MNFPFPIFLSVFISTPAADLLAGVQPNRHIRERTNRVYRILTVKVAFSNTKPLSCWKRLRCYLNIYKLIYRLLLEEFNAHIFYITLLGQSLHGALVNVIQRIAVQTHSFTLVRHAAGGLHIRNHKAVDSAHTFDRQ